MATSVLIVLTLKGRLKLPFVAAKASTEDHSRALELAGADVVVNPEKESAVRLAHTLGARGVTDYMAIRDDFGLARVKAPTAALARKLGDIDAQRQFKVVVVARLRDNSVSFNPDLDEVVLPTDSWCSCVSLSVEVVRSLALTARATLWMRHCGQRFRKELVKHQVRGRLFAFRRQ